MKILSTSFQNFPTFPDWEPRLDLYYTLILGSQASGKSLVLDAIYSATKATYDYLRGDSKTYENLRCFAQVISQRTIHCINQFYLYL